MLDTGFRAKTRALGELTPCAQCGEAIVAPTWSEHVNERCVRHLWECDACGYVRVLQKPFTEAELENCLRTLIGTMPHSSSEQGAA